MQQWPVQGHSKMGLDSMTICPFDFGSLAIAAMDSDASPRQSSVSSVGEPSGRNRPVQKSCAGLCNHGAISLYEQKFS